MLILNETMTLSCKILTQCTTSRSEFVLTMSQQSVVVKWKYNKGHNHIMSYTGDMFWEAAAQYAAYLISHVSREAPGDSIKFFTNTNGGHLAE